MCAPRDLKDGSLLVPEFKVSFINHIEFVTLMPPHTPRTWMARFDKKVWLKTIKPTKLRLYFTELSTGHRYSLYARDSDGFNFDAEAAPGDVFELTTERTGSDDSHLIAVRKITAAPAPAPDKGQ